MILPVALRKTRSRAIADHRFRLRPSGFVGIGAIGQQKRNAPPSEAGKTGIIRLPAMNRRVVEFVVARMHDHAERRLDAEADAIWYAVADVKTMQFEWADTEFVARVKRAQIRFL